MSKILIVEDDGDIAELVEYNLNREGYHCQSVRDGAKVIESVSRFKPDLIILDLMLPHLDGLEICRYLKAKRETQRVPIMMLTAKGEEVDRVVGFELGADDYLTKPFSTRELLLRVKAIFRRTQKDNADEAGVAVTYGDLVLDKEKYEVRIRGRAIDLTATEFKLLAYLLATKGRVATRDNLLDRVWGYSSALTTRTVDTHIKRLRQRLGKIGHYIETVRGIGYRLKATP